MNANPPRFDEIKTTRRIFLGLRAAAENLYGEEGLADIVSRLPPDVRKDTFDAALMSEWLPSRHVDKWFQAGWDGPVGKDMERFETFVQAVVEQGVSRFFRGLITHVSPNRVIQTAVAQYRRDNTRGRLRIEKQRDGARILLGDYGFEPTPFNTMTAAMLFKCGFQLCDVKNIQMTHELSASGELIINLRW